MRCHLHFVTGRAEERLTFDLQRMIAERIGFKGRGGLSGVERFMKAYFRIAKDVGDLTAIVCAELEARQAKRSSGARPGASAGFDVGAADALDGRRFHHRQQPHQRARTTAPSSAIRST